MKLFRGISAALVLLLLGSGCTNTAPDAQGVASETVTVSSAEAQDFLRTAFYEVLDLGFLVDCPADLSGTNGDRFTCYMCPELYAVPSVGGGYFYGDIDTEFRCDAAYEGFAVELVIRNSDFSIDFDSLRGATQERGSASPSNDSSTQTQDLDSNAGSSDTEEVEDTSQTEEAYLSQIRAWVATLSAEQATPFVSYIENCSTFACGSVEISMRFRASGDDVLEVRVTDSSSQLGTFDLITSSGDRSSVVFVELSGLKASGKRELTLEFYEAYSQQPVGSKTLRLDTKLGAMEAFFGRHSDNFENWDQGSSRQLGDPMEIARALQGAGVCDSISQDGSRLRCTRTSGESPGYDAYIYTRAADIVPQSLGRSWDHTTFFGSTWAVSVFYPGWTASDTDIVSRMDSLRWEVLRQDDRDPKGCVTSCFIARD
jgi:hypothetical protein